jgi:hypothetical protein
MILKGRFLVYLYRSIFLTIITFLILGAFLAVFGFSLPINRTKAAGPNTYYVDATGGLDGNDGLSTGTAWQTLAKVRSAQTGGSIHAGDTILFKKGQTFTGYLGVTVTGTAGNVLTFDSYGATGANPIIDATGQAQAVNLSGMSYITVNNLTIENATTQAFYFLNSNTHITIDHCTVTTSVHGADISTGSFSYLTFSNDNFSGMNRGISIGTLTALDNLSISNSTFNNNVQYGLLGQASVAATNTSITGSSFNSTTAGPGLNMTYGDGITITNSQFNNNSSDSNGYGITLRGCTNITLDTVTATGNSGSNISIINSGVTNPSNVTITRSTAGGSTGSISGIYILLTDTLAISNTTSNSNMGAGIYLAGDTHVTLNNVTADNNIKDGLRVANSDVVTAGSTTLDGGTFSGNSVGSIGYNGLTLFGNGDGFTATNVTTTTNGGDGFNIHGTWTNVIFNQCTADTNGTTGETSDGDGFSFHETASGIIKNSVSKNNKKSAIAHVGSASVEMDNNLFYHATNGTIGLVYLGETGTYKLYNNTIYSGSHTGAGVELATGGTETLIMKDNIISGFDYGIQEAGMSNLTEDYNLVYGATTANFSGITPGAHDVQLDPKFVSPMTDFSLQGDSPAIDAGYDTNIATDYTGMVRSDDLAVSDSGGGDISYYDIGAYEYKYIVPTTYDITATSGANGSVTPTGVTTVNSGSSRTYTITPVSGYHIADVLVDDFSQGAITAYTFNNILAAHTISATFTADTVINHNVSTSSSSSSSSKSSKKKYKVINKVKYRVYTWKAKYKKIFNTVLLRQQAAIAFNNLVVQNKLLVLNVSATVNKIVATQIAAPIKMSKTAVSKMMRTISLNLLHPKMPLKSGKLK